MTIPLEELTVPFEVLHVAVLNDTDKRVYTKEGPARARITGAVDQKLDRFIKDAELWTVGAHGWELVFSAKAGDHYTKISWKTVIEANKRRNTRNQAAAKRQKDDADFILYTNLRHKFEN